MKEALVIMLELQDLMNTTVHPKWREQGNAWYRAIWVECAELLDHYGWKWWKAQDPDMEQVELELIDIWHFGISIALERGDNYAEIAEAIATEMNVEPMVGDLRLEVEHFALKTLSTREFDAAGFAQLMALAGLDFDRLFRSYVAKNVLNIFRQDNGYKEGRYIKNWGGKEDNEHLMDIIGSSSKDQLNRVHLYRALEERYESLTV